MSTITEGAKKELSKSDLERWIEGKESIRGPLVKIEVAKRGTVGTFDEDADSPDTKPTIVLDPQGSAKCGSGKEVCRGEAYISGQRMKVLICR